MFTSIPNVPSASLENRLLAEPEHYCISFADAKKFGDWLFVHLPPVSSIAIQCAATGGLAPYPEKWLEDNLSPSSKTDKKFQFSYVIGTNIGQQAAYFATVLVRELANTYLKSPRRAVESVYVACGATQREIDEHHLRQEVVDQAINSLYK